MTVPAGQVAEFLLEATNAPDDPVFFYGYRPEGEAVDLRINAWNRDGYLRVEAPPDFMLVEPEHADGAAADGAQPEQA